jgi:hypothetical protein
MPSLNPLPNPFLLRETTVFKFTVVDVGMDEVVVVERIFSEPGVNTLWPVYNFK